jgi:hypothetical protein
MSVNRSNGHKIYQPLPLQDPPQSTQIGIFGLKIYHLATLLSSLRSKKKIRMNIKFSCKRFFPSLPFFQMQNGFPEKQ